MLMTPNKAETASCPWLCILELAIIRIYVQLGATSTTNVAVTVAKHTCAVF